MATKPRSVKIFLRRPWPTADQAPDRQSSGAAEGAGVPALLRPPGVRRGHATPLSTTVRMPGRACATPSSTGGRSMRTISHRSPCWPPPGRPSDHAGARTRTPGHETGPNAGQPLRAHPLTAHWGLRRCRITGGAGGRRRQKGRCGGPRPPLHRPAPRAGGRQSAGASSAAWSAAHCASVRPFLPATCSKVGETEGGSSAYSAW